MSRFIKTALAAGLIAGVTACAQPQPEEVVFVPPEPITSERPMRKY